MDPIQQLDRIHEMLTDEATDDGKQDRDSRYQAIVEGFYQIIHEQLPFSAGRSSDQPPNDASMPMMNPHSAIPLSSSWQSCFLQREVEKGDASLNPGLEELSVVSDKVPLQGNRGYYALKEGAGDGGIAHPYCINAKSISVSPPLRELSPCPLKTGGHAQPITSDGRTSLTVSSKDNDFLFVEEDEILDIDEDYTNLYSRESSLAVRGKGIGGGKVTRANINREKAMANSKVKNKVKNSDLQVAAGLHLLALMELLRSCAQAVVRADVRKANEILQELRENGASPHGNGLERMAHYFGEALMARMYGVGNSLYKAMSNNMLSVAKRLLKHVCPYIKISHYVANQSILKVAEGASRLHIVDYGILSGMQWPCLIRALADRKEGPPLLCITGIEYPQPGVKTSESLQDTGRRLAEYARTFKVPFEYHAVPAWKWENIEPTSLHLQRGEVLVVNCTNRLHHVPDESVAASDPRRQLLRRMRSLNPSLLVTVVLSAAHNSPFFLFRFREALHFYSNKFDMLDAAFCSDSPERMIVEREYLYNEIINVVACEGIERVERPETYKKWQSDIEQAGFEQLPIIPSVLSISSSYMQNHYHNDFNIHVDSNMWTMFGWKGRTIDAISSWKPILN